jgi:hypothetical protein
MSQQFYGMPQEPSATPRQAWAVPEVPPRLHELYMEMLGEVASAIGRGKPRKRSIELSLFRHARDLTEPDDYALVRAALESEQAEG